MANFTNSDTTTGKLLQNAAQHSFRSTLLPGLSVLVGVVPVIPIIPLRSGLKG
jgi:hypothetical protein